MGKNVDVSGPDSSCPIDFSIVHQVISDPDALGFIVLWVPLGGFDTMHQCQWLISRFVSLDAGDEVKNAELRQKHSFFVRR